MNRADIASWKDLKNVLKYLRILFLCMCVWYLFLYIVRVYVWNHSFVDLRNAMTTMQWLETTALFVEP